MNTGYNWTPKCYVEADLPLWLSIVLFIAVIHNPLMSEHWDYHILLMWVVVKLYRVKF